MAEESATRAIRSRLPQRREGQQRRADEDGKQTADLEPRDAVVEHPHREDYGHDDLRVAEGCGDRDGEPPPIISPRPTASRPARGTHLTFRFRSG
jgi:hypothetical protein